MDIIAKCPRCGSVWRYEESAADCRRRCLKCNIMFKVPKINEISEAAERVRGAKGQLYVDQDGNTYG